MTRFAADCHRSLVEPTVTLYRWRWRSRLPERHGQPFRVLARGTLN